MMRSFFLLAVLATAVACGQPKALLPKDTSVNPSTDCTTTDCFAVKTQKMEGIISHRQFLPNFSKCLNLPRTQFSAATNTAMAESLNTFSLEGNVKDLSAPMLMAATKVVGEICRDLINYEKANPTNSNRTFFQGYNLGVTNSQTYDFVKTAKAFADACWRRSATDAEIAVVNDALTTKTKDTAEALFVCTAMLSSAQALRQ